MSNEKDKSLSENDENNLSLSETLSEISTEEIDETDEKNSQKKRNLIKKETKAKINKKHFKENGLKNSHS